MKIAYIGMDATNYGSPSHECKVARVLAEMGHEVLLLTEREPNWGNEILPAGLKSLAGPVNIPNQAAGMAGMIPEDVDVAFASSASGAPIVASWMERTKKPGVAQVLDVPVWRLLWRDRAPWFEQWRPWFESLMCMTRLVANTERTSEDLHTAAVIYDYRRDDNARLPPTDVVYYGIDVDAADQTVALDMPPSWHGRRCVGVARLVSYKGFDLAIAALSLVRIEAQPRYLIVGAGEDQGRLAQLAQLSSVKAEILGGLSDTGKFGTIKAADFGLYLAFNPCIPSQFPMEAVYCGKACIVADLPINRERFLDHGVVYVDPFDTRQVAGAIEALSDAVPDASRHAEWIRENRSFKSHARGIEKVLGSVSA